MNFTHTHKAVFLDRDGVLNHDPGDYTYKPEEFTILPHVADCLKIWQQKGYLLIVITNQGGIGKGIYTIKDYQIISNLLQTGLEEQGVTLTEQFYCPHHPETSNCLCRKPGSLLLEKAIHLYKVDPTKSFFIGDKQRDIDAGNKVGVTGIKIEVNESLKNVLKFIP
ncbi:MAG: D-glycero-alpha-D-manno-heptose-1,7-bisphosphate 7-phosphatase [Luteibaculaceae bacterium]